MMTKILIIDDDAALCELIREHLVEEKCDVRSVYNGEDGLAEFRIYDPDLVLLDVNLPGKDGWQVCKDIRAISGKPIIFISGRADTVDKVLGLELGADDYIVKPLDLKEVFARIKAVIRRYTKHDAVEGELIRYDNLEISLQRYELRIDNVPVNLPPKELELIYYLASNCNRVFTRDQLLDKVWGFDYLGDSRTVDVHIKRLREKLSGASEKWQLRTVWGVGYKFEIL